MIALHAECFEWTNDVVIIQKNLMLIDKEDLEHDPLRLKRKSVNIHYGSF
jgi:hypothetical protein